MAFRWQADDGQLDLVVFGEKKRSKSWTPSVETLWIGAWCWFFFITDWVYTYTLISVPCCNTWCLIGRISSMLTRKTRYPCIDSVLIEMMNHGLRYTEDLTWVLPGVLIVLLNLLNKLWKRDKMRGLPSILSIFRNEFNKFNNTWAWMLDSIYHMTLRILWNLISSIIKHYNFVIMYGIFYGRHNVSRKSVNH